MELPHLGTHCAEPSCNKLDFLPFTCNLCSKEFCIDHQQYESHRCDESYRADVRVPVCPLCGQAVPSKRGEPPDLAVNQHLENNCTNKKNKIYTNKCSASGCKTKELVPVCCDSCTLNYCLRHRHPTDHQCQGPAAARERALAAATARAKTKPQQQQQQTVRRFLSPSSSSPRPTGHTAAHVPPESARHHHRAKVTSLQGGLTEEEALSQAMAASLLEMRGTLPSQPGSSEHRLAQGEEEHTEDTLLARTIAASLEESRRVQGTSSNSSGGGGGGSSSNSSCSVS